MTAIVERTVLFADLRGSTSMYERLGNADATAVVTQSVALLARIVVNHEGRVVKTLGDGLMAMLPRPMPRWPLPTRCTNHSSASERPAMARWLHTRERCR